MRAEARRVCPPLRQPAPACPPKEGLIDGYKSTAECQLEFKVSLHPELRVRDGMETNMGIGTGTDLEFISL